MKCRCGNKIPFWKEQFKIYECDDCSFVKHLRSIIEEIKSTIIKYPGKGLSILGKHYVEIALKRGILTKKDNLLTRRSTGLLRLRSQQLIQ